MAMVPYLYIVRLPIVTCVRIPYFLTDYYTSSGSFVGRYASLEDSGDDCSIVGHQSPRFLEWMAGKGLGSSVHYLRLLIQTAGCCVKHPFYYPAVSTVSRDQIRSCLLLPCQMHCIDLRLVRNQRCGLRDLIPRLHLQIRLAVSLLFSVSTGVRSKGINLT